MKNVNLANADIRIEMKKAGVKLWQIADALEVCEMTVTRKLRREMNCEEKAEIFALIAKITENRKGD